MDDGCSMYAEVMFYQSSVRYAMAKGSVACAAEFFRAGADPHYGLQSAFTVLQYELGTLMTLAHRRKGRRGHDMVRLLIDYGAWFSPLEIEGTTYDISFARGYRMQLAVCRLAQRALGRVLRGRVHRNVIPMVEAHVWSTRANERWLDACRQTK